MTPRTLCLLLVPVLATAAVAQAQDAPPGPSRQAAWKADYERLKAALAQGYANLDWQIDRRGFNLALADKQIGAMLDKVDNDAAAALVFAKLVEAFDEAPPGTSHLVVQTAPVLGRRRRHEHAERMLHSSKLSRAAVRRRYPARAGDRR